jgi:hypothetical protein
MYRKINLAVIEQDITQIQYGVIIQQVNCQGVMGAGLALQIAKKWPVVKEEYLDACHHGTSFGEDGFRVAVELGSTIFTHVANDLIVFSIFGQKFYGRDPNVVYTNYVGLGKGLRDVADCVKGSKLPVYIPHGLGCGLAGGDWKIVTEIIKQEISNAIICIKPVSKNL